ncbi:MAG: tetratricopeptide repeat protein [Rhodospirillales bacterium]|nr:tetratricopeptide repeat protein [Rhodospirillales bacterium]MDE0378813.1 tetratricopeptide repeat protein [Rhodospirillales bacterium]
MTRRERRRAKKRGPGAAPAGADPVDGILRVALGHHRAGRAAEAAALYERILQQRPGHADTLHLFGILHAQTGRLEGALPLLTRAVRKAPRNAGFLSDLGSALRGLGRHDEAIAHYRRAAALDAGNANVRYNLGHALRAAGRADEATGWLRKALAIQPDHGPALLELGRALLDLGAAEEAVAAFRQAVAVDDGAASAHSDLGNALRETGALEEAEASLRRAVALAPEHAAVHANLGNVLQDLNRTDEAEAAYREAIALDPEHAIAHANLGNALKRLGREDEAVASLERALELRPENATYRANLGMVHVARGDAAAALASFGFAAAQRHGSALAPAVLTGRQPERPAVPVAPFKLQHDAEQIRRLCNAGRIDASFGRVAESYERILAALPADARPEAPVALQATDWRRIAAAYNRPLHLPEAPAAADAAVNPDLDAAAIESAYRESAPNLVVVDDFLSRDALERLWQFCLDATVWYQVKQGYLGAYLVDGFATGLALQIADELRARLPGIFGRHRLEQLWAYKYDSRLQGIATHADFAAVNVNFWVTPDEANRDPASGGLVIHRAHAPTDWAFRTYNADSARMAAFLAEAGEEPVTVPYRQNRVVIFDSDLFHRTDDLDFRPGYENRRINVTMLFGDRSER